jgi:hypothetical protein
MRRGVWLLLLGLLVAAVSAASARADGSTTSATTTAAATPSYAPLAATHLPAACVGAGAAAIVVPGAPVLALGTPASALGPSAYPTSASAITFDSSATSGSTCKTTHVALTSVSLFGGFVTASSVAALNGRGSVSGLTINGSPVALSAGGSALLGYWGQLTLGKTLGRLRAPLAVLLLKRYWNLPAGTMILVGFTAAALPVHVATSQRSTETPRRTSTTPTAKASSKSRSAHVVAAKKKHRERHVPQPLTAVPSLGYKASHYVFPVNGGASYVDTYGANRSDIYDGWHHGDDLFAKLGTPVLAVAKGTLSLVGWNQLGGWRLWLTDGKGNSFYYAHLAGYSRWILDHPHVKAGQVIGFLGRTGDAFTTEPHLHFEIHPALYLSLGYDGAVDPTTYLEKWHTVWVPAKEMPQPAKLKAPIGTPAEEASVVWHELLAARHLLGAKGDADSAATDHRLFPHPPSVEASGVAPPPLAGVQPTAAHVSGSEDMAPWLGGGLSGALVLAALSAGAFTVRRRRRTAGEAPSLPDAS